MRVRRALPLVGIFSWGNAMSAVPTGPSSNASDNNNQRRGKAAVEGREGQDMSLRLHRGSHRRLRHEKKLSSGLGTEDESYWERYLGLFDWRLQHLSMPTASPIRRTGTPSVAPAVFPPSKQPMEQPTPAPDAATPIPSIAQPTEVPTVPPSPGLPTIAPETSRPTTLPSVMSSPSPLPTLTPIVTASPTEKPSTTIPTSNPTEVLTAPPTAPPTPLSACSLNMTSSCTNCEGNTIIDPVCQGPPTQLIMRYTGGSCNQTSTTQQIPCFDFQGGPSSEPGSQGFVVVTFLENVYHQAWVTVGSQYTIQDESGAELGAPQSIVVYQSEDQSPSNVLQSLLFDGSCSETVELLNQFGASQVVGFTANGDTTLAFFNATIELDISVPNGPDARLQSLQVTSSEGPIDLTGQVAGTTVTSGASETTSFTVTLDVTVPRVLLFLSNVTATNADEPLLSCSAESFLSIPVGPVDEVDAGNFQTANHGTLRGPF